MVIGTEKVPVLVVKLAEEVTDISIGLSTLYFYIIFIFFLLAIFSRLVTHSGQASKSSILNSIFESNVAEKGCNGGDGFGYETSDASSHSGESGGACLLFVSCFLNFEILL